MKDKGHRMNSITRFTARLLAGITLFWALIPAHADGGAVIISDQGAVDIAANEKLCTLSHRPDDDPRTFGLLLGSRSNETFELEIDVALSDATLSGQLEYSRQNATYRAIDPAGRAQLLVQLAFDANEISDEAYFAGLDEAEALDGQLNPVFAEATILIDGTLWPNYVAQRRATEQFPASKVAMLTFSINDIPVVSETPTGVDSMSVTYEGACRILLFTE